MPTRQNTAVFTSEHTVNSAYSIDSPVLTFLAHFNLFQDLM
nr:MAG TPA: hypothetical protein [Caudoviricetes sp.]